MEASKPCQDSSATSLLTKNQKKKRRQKLSKLGKQDPSAGSDASCMSAVSVLSSRHFRQAAAVPAHLQPSKLHNLADLEPSREQSSAAPSAGQQSAAAAVQDREPSDTAELASSCCTAQTWLGSQDCSTQAACIAAALVSRSDPAAGPAEDPEPSAASPVLGSKRTRTVSEHGNYRRYYGYRLGGAPDPRLQVNPRLPGLCKVPSRPAHCCSLVEQHSGAAMSHRCKAGPCHPMRGREACCSAGLPTEWSMPR